MRHTSVLLRILLVSLLVLLGASRAGVVSAGVHVWTSHGPEGGDIFALAIDPATPTTLYAGTNGGVFKSTNSGGNWSAVNTGLTHTSVNALAIDPATPTTLYAGTYGGGVFDLQQTTETPTATPTPTLTNIPTYTPTPTRTPPVEIGARIYLPLILRGR